MIWLLITVMLIVMIVMMLSFVEWTSNGKTYGKLLMILIGLGFIGSIVYITMQAYGR
jgi:hypothetical protein